MNLNSKEKQRVPIGAADALTFSTSSTPGSHQLAIAGTLTILLLVLGAAVTPIAEDPLIAVPGFMTAFGSGMIVINLLLAALLLSKGSIERRADAVRLGTAYLFVGTIFVPLSLSFKDGFVPGMLIGKPGSSVWLWAFWHAGFSLAILWYALGVGRTSRVPSVRACCAGVLVASGGLAAVATLGFDDLPAVLTNGRTFFTGPLSALPPGLLWLNGGVLLLCVRLRARTTEHLWVTVAMVAACFDLWLTLHGTSRFALGWYVSKCGSFATSLIVMVSQFHDVTNLYRRSAEANRALEQLAHRDGLTGVYNRRRFDTIMSDEWFKAEQHRDAVSLLLIDVDFFKQFNDQCGHLAGDECLKAVALCLDRTAARKAHSVTRYGGEEFAVLLPGKTALAAVAIAEDLRAAVENLVIPHHHGLDGCVTVSIGVSTLVPDAKTLSPTLVRLADDALYLAKSRGRNQVAASGEISEPVQGGKPQKMKMKLVFRADPAA